MSYQLGMETNKKKDVEMPPLAPETPLEKPKYELHPDLQNALPKETEQSESEPEVEEEAPIEQPKQETAQAKNFRQLKEQKERAERERDELVSRLKSYEQAKHATQEVEEPDLNIDPNDLVEGKHLSKYDKKIKKLQDQLQLQQQQSELTATEIRLKHEMPDFDKVVCNENINELKLNYPELANTLNSSNIDIYSKAKAAYTMIKKMGIGAPDHFEEDRQKTIKNAVKPKPLASISPQQGDSPLSRANAFASGLTDELKEQLRKEMFASIKNG